MERVDMMLWRTCFAAALCAVAAAFVPAGAQTQVEGVVQPEAQPPVQASQPVVHAVPLHPPASAAPPAQKPAEEPPARPAEKPAEKPVEKPAQKPAEKPAHKPARKPHIHEPTHKAAPPLIVEPEPPMLPAPPSQPAQQPVLTPQPYAQPAPAPQPYAPVPAPAPAPSPQPQPQPYAQPQPAPQPPAQAGAEPVVNWTLEVIRNGQQVDSFDGTTAVGQARTDRHHKLVTHAVGCKDQPAGSIDLQRTITVSPVRVDPTDVVLSIDAYETIESDLARQTREGCRLPPQPSQVHARHPGLVVPTGQWVTWPIVSQDPALSYRVRASLAPSSAQP
jgi:hypothetical protein